MRDQAKAPEGDRRRTAAALACAVFGLCAPLAYETERLYELSRAPMPDPRLIIRSSHVAFFWRASTASWLGVLVAIVAYAIAAHGSRSAPRRLMRLIGLGLIPLVALLLLLTWSFP